MRTKIYQRLLSRVGPRVLKRLTIIASTGSQALTRVSIMVRRNVCDLTHKNICYRVVEK